MVSHAAYPGVTKERIPASLSTMWINDILRKRIGYNGFIVSDDMEMGAVLKYAPIEQTVVQHIRAGGDMALVCYKEELIVRAYEALIHEAERDVEFANRVARTLKRIQFLRMKLFGLSIKRRASTPATPKVERLSRQLWEFGEEVRMATLARTDNQKERA